MPLNNPLSLSGFEADLDALCKTHAALMTQQTALRDIVTEHNNSGFLPKYLVETTRTAAYNKGVSQDIFETLILIGLVASFQQFIKILVSDVLNHLASSGQRFSELEENFRDSYLIAAASTYRFKNAGSVHGVEVDFTLIEQSLRSCFGDAKNYTLVGEAITSRMGNPRESAIADVFAALALKEPFDSDFGGMLKNEGWAQASNNNENTKMALKHLDRNIDRRNDAAHSFSKIVFASDEISELIEFFRVFGKCLFIKANQKF